MVTKNLFNIGAGNGSLPDGIKQLPLLMLSYYQVSNQPEDNFIFCRGILNKKSFTALAIFQYRARLPF